MQTVRSISLAIGDKVLAQALGVAPSTVRTARQLDEFPASWFLILQKVCDERGIDCPVELFSFRRPKEVSDGFLPSENYGTSCAENQENNDIYGVAV